MANYDSNQTDDFSQTDAPAGADDFAFDGDKAPANRSGIILLFILLLGGGGLYFLYTQSSFAKGNEAVVAPGPDSAGAAAQIATIRQGLAETRRTVQIFEQISARPYVPVADLQANPFSTLRDKAVVPPPGGGKPEVDAQTQQFMQATQDMKRLQLGSMMDAAENSTCTINRRLLKVGQKIRPDGGGTEFTFLRIESVMVDERPQSRVVLGAYGQEFILARR